MNNFKTMKEQIYDYITDAIMNGELEPNHFINESELSKKIGISRTPVREALIRLSSEGVLESSPRKGFLLRSMDIKEAKDLYHVIGKLDAMAAEAALNNMKQEDYQKMEDLIEKMDETIETEDYTGYLKYQDSFHDVYIMHSGNAALFRVIESLKKEFLTRGITNDTGKYQSDYLKGINEEHKEILKLFKEGNITKLTDYIENVHWNPSAAGHELFTQ